ncbi:hypothetical protein [Rhizobium sp. 21-4511-3d]
MSASAMKWAKRQVIEDRTLKAVVMAIAAATKGNECKETQGSLADAANIKERALRNALVVLETFGVLSRHRQKDWAKRGRSADLIALNTGLEFHLTREAIMSHRSLGPTGISSWDQPAPDAGAPTGQNDIRHIDSTHAQRISLSSPPESSRSVSVSTHVRFDRGRCKWRSSITVDGVTMDLGRFDERGHAEAYAVQAEADVRRTSSMKPGTPSFPVVPPSKAKLDAPSLGAWLFGDDDEPPCENGDGEAVALGQGAKLLGGCGAQPCE